MPTVNLSELTGTLTFDDGNGRLLCSNQIPYTTSHYRISKSMWSTMLFCFLMNTDHSMVASLAEAAIEFSILVTRLRLGIAHVAVFWVKALLFFLSLVWRIDRGDLWMSSSFSDSSESFYWGRKSQPGWLLLVLTGRPRLGQSKWSRTGLDRADRWMK